MIQNNLQGQERLAVLNDLVPEFRAMFIKWNDEYSTQERDLGAVGEFVNLWRKAKRVKAALMDGADTSTWREPLRTVLFEIICHAFLLLFDLSKMTNAEASPTVTMVPNCGHPLCIDHPKVPVLELDDAAMWVLRRSENPHE